MPKTSKLRQSNQQNPTKRKTRKIRQISSCKKPNIGSLHQVSEMYVPANILQMVQTTKIYKEMCSPKPMKNVKPCFKK